VKKEPIELPADPADAEDFDVTAEALDRGQRARLIRKTRTGLGLSQSEFASRFRVPVGTLRDWEQARVTGRPWNKPAPAPPLPQDVIEKTAAKYREAFERLTG